MNNEQELPGIPNTEKAAQLSSERSGDRASVPPRLTERLQYETDPSEITKIVRDELEWQENVGAPFYPDRRGRIEDYELRPLRLYLRGLSEAAQSDELVKLQVSIGENGEYYLRPVKAELTSDQRKEIGETADKMIREITLRQTFHNSWVAEQGAIPDWGAHCSFIKDRYKVTWEGEELAEMGRLKDIGPQIDGSMRCFVYIALSKGFPRTLDGLAKEFGGEVTDSDKIREIKEARKAGRMTAEQEKVAIKQAKIGKMLEEDNKFLTKEQKILVSEAYDLELDNIFADPHKKKNINKVFQWIKNKTGAERATVEQAIKIFGLTGLNSTFGIHNADGYPEQSTTSLTPDITGQVQYFQVKYMVEGEYYKSPEDSVGQAPIGNPGLQCAFPGLITDIFRGNNVPSTEHGKRTLWEIWWNDGVKLGSLPVEDVDSLELDQEDMQTLKEEGITDVTGDNIYIMRLVRMFFAGKLKSSQYENEVWGIAGSFGPKGLRNLNKQFNLVFPKTRSGSGGRERLWQAKINLAASKLISQLGKGIFQKGQSGELHVITSTNKDQMEIIYDIMVRVGYLRKEDRDYFLGIILEGKIPQWKPEFLTLGSFEPEGLTQEELLSKIKNDATESKEL